MDEADIIILNVRREIIRDQQHTIYMGEIKHRATDIVLGSFELNLKDDVVDSTVSLIEGKETLLNHALGTTQTNLQDKKLKKSFSNGGTNKKFDLLPVVKKNASIDLGKLTRKTENVDSFITLSKQNESLSHTSVKSTNTRKSYESEERINSSKGSNRSANSSKVDTKLDECVNFDNKWDIDERQPLGCKKEFLCNIMILKNLS